MAITPYYNQQLKYEDFIADGWRDGFVIPWDDSQKQSWDIACQGIYGKKLTEVAGPYLDNTACIVRSDQSYQGKKFPEAGFKFLYTVRNNELFWAIVFIDFGIVTVDVLHYLNNYYRVEASFFDNTLISINGAYSNIQGGIGTVVNMGHAVPGKCQVVFCGSTNNLPTSDYSNYPILTSVKFGYYNPYWTVQSPKPVMTCGNQNAWPSAEASGTYNLSTAVANGADINAGLVPNDIKLDQDTVSYLQWFSVSTDGDYVKLGNGSWQKKESQLQAISKVTPQMLYYSYWGAAANNICSITTLNVQNAPRFVQMGQTFENNILTLSFSAHENKWKNGYFYGINLSDDGTHNFSNICFPTYDFITSNQSIQLKKENGDLKYLDNSNQWETAIHNFSGNVLTITCYGSDSYDLTTAGDEFTWEFGAANSILYAIQNCYADIKNYYIIGNAPEWESTKTYQYQDIVKYGYKLYSSRLYNNVGHNPETSSGYWDSDVDDYALPDTISICFTVKLESELDQSLDFFVKYYNYRGLLQTQQFSAAASQADPTIYRIKLEGIDPTQPIVFQIIDTNTSDVISERTVNLDTKLVNCITQIQTSANDSYYGKLIEKDRIQNICQAIQELVVENYSKIGTISQLNIDTNLLRTDVNLDYNIIFDDYVKVITDLKNVYDEISAKNWYYNGTNTVSPLQKDDEEIIVPENSFITINSNDISLVPGTSNQYIVSDQETEGTENPFTWVAPVANPFKDKLIVADLINGSLNPIEVNNNFQNQITYIVNNLF